MFGKKNNSENQFKESLKQVMSDPEVAANEKIFELFQEAAKKVAKNEAVTSISSNLALQLRSNFSENELPRSVIEFQLEIGRYAAIGANGVVF